MRILFFSSVFPQPGNPTRGTFCLNMVKAMARRHELRVVSPWPWHMWLKHGIRCPRRQATNEEISAEFPVFVYPPRIRVESHDRYMWLSGRTAFQRAADAIRPEFVLSYWTYPDGGAALMAARSIGVPSGLIVGGSDVLLIDDHPARHRFIEVLKAVDLVLPVSHCLGEKLEELGVDPSKISVVEQGVDEGRFYPGDRREARARLGLTKSENMLLWVGRMVPVKGLDVLMRACALLRAREISFQLYLVGDGPLRGAISRLASELALTDVVHLAGSRPQPELGDWYRAADMLVLPSHSEGIPNVLREGLACGRPYVASDVGGVSELAAPGCRLVPPGDVDELASAIEAVLGESPDRQGLPQTASARSWEDTCRDLTRAIETCIDGRASRTIMPWHSKCRARTMNPSE